MFEHDFVGFSADAGLFIASERCACGEIVVGIDPHTAGVYAAGYFEGGIDILCEDCSAQTVYTVIGKGDDFIGSLEFLDDYYRSEDFFLADSGSVLVGNEDGRFHEIAFVAAVFGVSFTACDKLGSFIKADLYIFQYFILLGFVNLGTQLGFRIRRITNFYSFEGSFQGVSGIHQRFLPVRRGGSLREADLALVEEDALACAVYPVSDLHHRIRYWQICRPVRG